MKDRKQYKIEVHRFKDTGKYYETLTLEVEATNDNDALRLVREERNRREGSGMYWLVTGVGLQYEVPRLLI